MSNWAVQTTRQISLALVEFSIAAPLQRFFIKSSHVQTIETAVTGVTHICLLKEIKYEDRQTDLSNNIEIEN